MLGSGDQKKGLNIKQRLSCGVGHVFNDLFRHLYMSFEIVFLMQVVELPAFQAGMILLITQIVEAFFSLLIGYLCDRVDIPLISKRMGRRKSWHLVGTLLMALTLPFLYNKCLLCSNHKTVGWAQFAYYVSISVAGNVSFSVVEINHLSVISAVARTLQEGMAVNAIRFGISYLTFQFFFAKLPYTPPKSSLSRFLAPRTSEEIFQKLTYWERVSPTSRASQRQVTSLPTHTKCSAVNLDFLSAVSSIFIQAFAILDVITHTSRCCQMNSGTFRKTRWLIIFSWPFYRTAFSFLTGIFVYLIAWGLLGQDSGASLGPEDVSSFAVNYFW